MAAAVEAAGRSIERFAQLDLDLHRAIWELAGNRTLARLLEQVTAPVFAMATVVRSAGPRPGRPHARNGGHAALVEAICSGSEREAAAAMRTHLTANWKDLQKRLAAYHKERQ
jgi:DNA-binding FadR family transcriptional regulator